ncbi:MAG: hypothetical protein H6747_09895 [Deltaproteobacteria bacterium]|nr:hypothetical protein [Deltaproteobacteria bacterium]
MRKIATSFRMTRTALCGALALALLAGCENEVDSSPNNLNVGAADSGSQDVVAGECDCLQKGTAWRFDKLTLDSIDNGPHNVQIALNPLWKKDIAGFELNFYAEVLEVSPTEVKIRIVNGARIVGSEKDVCLLPYTGVEVTFPREGCRLKPSAPAAMNVYAGTPANPKNCAPAIDVPHSIPVRGAVLEALIASDCGRVDDGLVSAGHLPEPALAKTCTCLTTGNQNSESCGEPDQTFADPNKNADNPGCDGCNSKFQNLKTLLNNFGELKYECKEGNDKAACLTASFAGAKVDALPAVCAGF